MNIAVPPSIKINCKCCERKVTIHGITFASSGIKLLCGACTDAEEQKAMLEAKVDNMARLLEEVERQDPTVLALRQFITDTEPQLHRSTQDDLMLTLGKNTNIKKP